MKRVGADPEAHDYMNFNGNDFEVFFRTPRTLQTQARSRSLAASEYQHSDQHAVMAAG